MMILSFNRAQYFHQNLTDTRQLGAFALGSELPSVHTLIGNKPAMALTSLHEQSLLETIAKQCYDDFMKMPPLQAVLNDYAENLLFSDISSFADVRLHAKTPGLPLAKYYSAIKHTYLDRTLIWEKHLQCCKALSLAMYEHCTDPRSHICYDKDSVMVNKPHAKQCVYYSDVDKASVFSVGEYEYHQRPWPVKQERSF